jgi:hypothetical protein
MTPAALQVRVTVRWWVIPYLYTLAALCAALRTRPDPAKVAYWVCRGIKTEAIR